MFGTRLSPMIDFVDIFNCYVKCILMHNQNGLQLTLNTVSPVVVRILVVNGVEVGVIVA